jgi:hypothetical protein
LSSKSYQKSSKETEVSTKAVVGIHALLNRRKLVIILGGVVIQKHPLAAAIPFGGACALGSIG